MDTFNINDLETGKFYTGEFGPKLKAGTVDIFNLRYTGKEVIRIANDGNVYWHGRLVESDDDFKSAMLDLAEALKGNL